MKRFLPIIILTFFIIAGVFALAFVLKMIWYTPSPMGMMMGRHMMYSHMSFWFGRLVWLLLIIFGVIILIYLIVNKNKK